MWYVGIKKVKHGIYPHILTKFNLLLIFAPSKLVLKPSEVSGFHTTFAGWIFCASVTLCCWNTLRSLLAVWGILSSSTQVSFERHSFLRFHRDHSVTAKSSSCCLLVCIIYQANQIKKSSWWAPDLSKHVSILPFPPYNS